MALYEYIQNVEQIHRRCLALEKEERELTTPIINDYSMMGEIYGIFSDEIVKKTNIKIDSIESRRIFIFIIMRLCCPSVFANQKLKRGIRDRIAETLNVEASIVSHDFRNLTFHYKRYRNFRSTVDSIYESMMDTLSEK